MRYLKSVIARGSKLYQLIDGDELSFWYDFLKNDHVILLQISYFENLDIAIL